MTTVLACSFDMLGAEYGIALRKLRDAETPRAAILAAGRMARVEAEIARRSANCGREIVLRHTSYGWDVGYAEWFEPIKAAVS